MWKPIHYIHHIQWSFGYTLWPLPFGYFKNYGFRRIRKEHYHDCTATLRY